MLLVFVIREEVLVVDRKPDKCSTFAGDLLPSPLEGRTSGIEGIDSLGLGSREELPTSTRKNTRKRNYPIRGGAFGLSVVTGGGAALGLFHASSDVVGFA
jgi:hypothetical protein